MKYFSQSLLVLSVATTLTTTLALSSATVQAADQVAKYEGRAVTGANRYLGQPVQDYGPPLNTFGFYNMAVYNPDGDEPIMIDENTSLDSVLATAVDPTFLIAAGLPLSLIDESLNNIELRNVGINIGGGGENRVTLPSTLDVDPISPSQAGSMAQITLRDWLAAEGTATFHCSDDSNSVAIKVQNLMPNRLYTVWGLFQTAQGKFKAATLGGTPNAIATDRKGNGTFKRELGFCAMEPTQSGAKLIAMDIIYHSDHQVYAAVPGLTLKRLITGTNTHSHLWFTVQGIPLLD